MVFGQKKHVCFKGVAGLGSKYILMGLFAISLKLNRRISYMRVPALQVPVK